MDTLKKLLGVAIVVCGLMLFPTGVALSQDMCEGNFDYDKDVDGTDASVFKSDFGRSQLKNPCPGGFAAVEKTGQTTSYTTGDDGDLKKGVPFPNPRFIVFGTGEEKVLDNLTGVIWSRENGAAGADVGDWSMAVELCMMVPDEDGYTYRLANVREMSSIIAYQFNDPAVCNYDCSGKNTWGNPFYAMASDFYWTSTTCSTGSQ